MNFSSCFSRKWDSNRNIQIQTLKNTNTQIASGDRNTNTNCLWGIAECKYLKRVLPHMTDSSARWPIDPLWHSSSVTVQNTNTNWIYIQTPKHIYISSVLLRYYPPPVVWQTRSKGDLKRALTLKLPSVKVPTQTYRFDSNYVLDTNVYLDDTLCYNMILCATIWLVDRPTQPICISDIYVNIQIQKT